MNSSGKIYDSKGQGTATITSNSSGWKQKEGKLSCEGDWEDYEQFCKALVAHRGLSSEAPGDTVKAFELAGDAGFWGVAETDIRMTKDGKFVAVHVIILP